MSESPDREVRTGNLEDLKRLLPVPSYDRSGLPGGIVHIGVGGFHRAHQALYLHELLEAGERSWSITGAGVMEADEATREAAQSQDCLYTLIEKDASGRSARIVGSITDYLFAPDDRDGFIEALADEATRIVSLTITEAGYPINEQTQEFDPDDRVIAGDLARRNNLPSGAIGAIVEALDRRRRRGLGPFTVQSCDNIVNNGHVTRSAVVGMADAWAGADLRAWVESHGAFPNSMVDRITPAASPEDARWLQTEFGIIDKWPIAAETFRQWAIEDAFVAGRPPWEAVGALITADVRPYELAKVRLLNAGHSAIAYLGAVAGHEFIHQTMDNTAIRDFYVALMAEEIAPTLPPIAGVDLTRYQAQLVERFANPEIGDQVARVCLDGSSKQPKFTMPIVRDQLHGGGSIRLLALATAGWCHYLASAADEQGKAITHAADPYLDDAVRHARASVLEPHAFLDFEFVFGSDLRASAHFRQAFVTALSSLRAHGVGGAIAETLGANGHA